MSLRPRPVTATVTKPKWMEPQVFRPRSLSLDSGGSTASLTSVLDHDSYISPSPSDDEEDWTYDKENCGRSAENEVKGDNNKEHCIDRKAPERKLAEYDESTYTEVTESENSPEGKLSPWEKWLISKTKSERKSRKQKVLEKKEQKQKQEEEKLTKEKDKEKIEENRRKWLAEKQERAKLRRKMEHQRVKMEERLKTEQERDIAEKAEKEFKKWKVEKKKAEREKEQKERQKQQEKEQKQVEKQKKAEDKYKEWCLKAANRPKSVPNSFGYTSGKLTGYHDTSAYPPPSFYNPLPWHHNPVPKQKTDKNKIKTKPSKAKNYVWNPSKYF
ncbi:coiled-coil domain-containing protein 34-like isoform X2 [Mizuhopecten yessoensis]|uniref:coiled-coil domain-containing protein 34-like isoform X2 n=1 Tax=Mizuhopecten yessoensis TaxID=6573 RepID=UPI000B457C7A|nr:coiled-coil domain-containing protein 34-like isoform X2 [Mizuhopecten yessoensis]